MARVCAAAMRAQHDVVGFSVDRAVAEATGPRFDDAPLIAFDAVADAFPPARHAMLVAVGFRDMNALRLARMREAQAMGYPLASFVADTARVARGTPVDENVVILDHVSIHAGCRIGPGCFLTGNINLGHDCTLGAGVWMNAGVSLAGGVVVGEGCFFGVNACVAEGVRLGPRSFVGANAFIGKDTEADAVMIAPQAERYRMKSADFLRHAGLQ